MEEQKPQSKIWKALLLGLLIVGLPAVSYFYLKGGLEWRKTAVAELSDYGKIPEAFAILEDSRRINLLENKVCVVHLFGDKPELTDANKQVIEVYFQLADQFGITDDFRVVSVWNGGGLPDFNEFYNQKKEPREPTWIHTGGGKWTTVMINQYENFRLKTKSQEVPTYLALVDQNGTIRRFYNALDNAEVQRLVQHIAILLPQPKN